MVSVALAWGLFILYVSKWAQPPANPRSGDPFAWLPTAILTGGVVFIAGAALGGFVALRIARWNRG